MLSCIQAFVPLHTYSESIPCLCLFPLCVYQLFLNIFAGVAAAAAAAIGAVFSLRNRQMRQPPQSGGCGKQWRSRKWLLRFIVAHVFAMQPRRGGHCNVAIQSQHSAICVFKFSIFQSSALPQATADSSRPANIIFKQQKRHAKSR